MKLHTPQPLVLCEGKEDLLVIEALADHAGLGDKLTFLEYGGKDNLRSYLHLLKATPAYVRGEYSKVLVTRDADDNFDSSWAALKGAIGEAFSCEPQEPGECVKVVGGQSLERAIPKLPIDWDDAAFLPLRHLLEDAAS